MPYYDEDGNPVEGILEPEQAKELQEKTTKMEELLDEKTKELESYSDKDFNFSKLRNKTKEEKDELLKEFDEKERTFINEIADLRNTVDDNHSIQMATYESEVIKAMAGDDEDLQTKLKETAKEFVGSPRTQDEIFSRYKNAYTLVQGSAPTVNPINKFTPTSISSAPDNQKKRYTDTDQGKENYKNWFPDSPSSQKKD